MHITRTDMIIDKLVFLVINTGLAPTYVHFALPFHSAKVNSRLMEAAHLISVEYYIAI
jgi:hypothetical protein